MVGASATAVLSSDEAGDGEDDSDGELHVWI
jgi:hypothetical protein